MKIRIIISLVICCFAATGAFSQPFSITGTVKNKTTKQGVEFATVSILTADSTVIAGVSTKADGSFVLEGIKRGSYTLQASFVGYEPYNVTFSPEGAKDFDIQLTENMTMLKEAVAYGRRSFIQQEVDKYVVNISDHIVTAGKNGLDILKFTPGLLVYNRNVTIMGDNVDVWIDGRPSRMTGGTLAAFLESLNGDDVEQIEVITNPSSKYDAGGGRGIVNIKTKKNKNLNMLNGSANVGYELSKRQKGIGGLGLNYRVEKFNVYGSYGIRGGNDISTINETTTNLAEARAFDRSTEFDVYRTISNNYRVGADFFPNKSNILGFLFSGFSNNDAITPTSTTTIAPPLNGTSLSLMGGDYKSTVQGQTYNLNYKHTFKKPGSELNVDADYGHIVNDKNQTQNYLFFSSTGDESEPSSSERSSLPQKTKMWSAKVDYQYPFSKSSFFSTGAKAGGSETDNNIMYEQLNGNSWVNDATKSNHFVYNENIYAAYVEWGQQLKKWGYKLGLRTEYTFSEGDQLTTSQANRNEYWDIFPTLYLQYMASQDHVFGFACTRRTRRPSYQTLNPFEIALDNYSYMAGNPNLEPSYNNNLELKYSFKQKFTATLSLTHIENMILSVPVANEDDSRFGYVYDNFGNRTAYIFMLNYNNTFFKIWRLGFMGQLAYIENRADKPDTGLNNDGLSGAVWCSNSFQIGKTLSVEATLLLLPVSRMGYTKSDVIENNLSIGVRKNLFKNKASVSISANDILGQAIQNTTSLNGIHIKREQDNNQRSVTINLSYKFGSDKVKSARSRNTGIEDEVKRSTSAESK